MAKVKKAKSKGAKTSSEEMAIKGAIPLSFYRKAVRSTEKKFSLTSSSLQVPFRLSFGLLVFDLLSGGGIIPGFMVQISGKEGSGKCLKGDSLVPTSKGIMRLDELYNNTNDKVVITHKHVKKQLTGSYKTSGKTISITTNYGDVVEGLAEHRMWVYRGAQLGFRRLDAIKAGDWLPKSLGTNLFPKETPKFNYTYKESDYRDVTQFDVKIPKVMTEEFAELLGLYIAEGHKGRFTNYNKEILERYIQLIYKVFGASRELEASGTVIGFGKIIKDFINTLVPETTSAFKQIPLVIRQSPRKIQAAFIRGLFEGDSSVYTKNSNGKKSSVLELSSISRRLAYESKAILENMGIACYVITSQNYASNTEAKRKVTTYKLIVMQPYLEQYKKDIAFISSQKNELLNKAIQLVDNYNDYSTASVGRINTMPGIYWLQELKIAIKKVLDTTINVKTGKPFGLSALVPYYLRDKNNKDSKFTSIFSNLESNKCKNLNREQVYYLVHVLRVNAPLNKKVWRSVSVRECIKNLIALTKETWAQVKTVTKNRRFETVYDLQVAEDSSYHVNGLIGHNSTLSGHLFRSSILSNVPIIEYRDPENALTDSMMENIVRYKDPTTLFSGKEQRAFYYADSGLEVFYNSIKHTLKALPDKLWDQERKSWFFVFDADKAGRAMMADAGFTKYDKEKFQDTGRLWVATDDSAPQGIVILDSYPALLTEKDDEDEESSNAMAMDARAFSKNIKRIAGRLKRKGFIVMGVNQIRDRPGVMYGCLHGDTVIPFVDGSQRTIREIVENKIRGKVWAWDEKTRAFVKAPITNWFDNGKVESKNDWITLTSDEAVATKNGVVAVTVTPNHKILTRKGWKKAKDITTDDYVLSKYPSQINGTVEEFVYGTLIGDSTLVKGHAKNTASMRIRDSKNPEYAKWKREKLFGLNFKEWKNLWSSDSSYELAVIKAKLGNRDPVAVKEHLSALSLAVHYMDDGCFKQDRNRATFSYGRFKNDFNKLVSIADVYATLGFDCDVWRDGVIAIARSSEEAFFKAIRRYVPPCMQYKLPEAHRGYYKHFTLRSKQRTNDVWVRVTEITRGSNRKFRQRGKYDIEVKGFANYLAGNPANGFIVHNSPEYEPGGNALAFYSSLRFQVRKVSVPTGLPKGKTEDGNDSPEFSTEKSIYGGGRRDNYVYINVRNTKNKGGVPLMRAKMRILFSDGRGRMLGYDPVWDVLEYLKALGRRSGSMKKGFQLNVPGMDKKFKGFSKRTLDYMDIKLLVMAEHLKEKKLIKRVEKELKLKPILIKTLMAEMRKSPTAVRDLLEAASDTRKELKDDDGQADLEA